MLRKHQSSRSGFTLVEIMIVVAIIALLASIAVPSFLRARKRSQATATLESARMLDDAKSQYAIENGKAGTDTFANPDILPYLKRGTKLYNQMLTGTSKDELGHDFIYGTIDDPIKVDPTTQSALADALGANPDEFWGAYK